MRRIPLFHALLKEISKKDFSFLVKKHNADRGTKGFGSWQHMLTMVFAQLSGASSLRDLEVSFNYQIAPRHYQTCRPIKKSTLADANMNRNDAIFVDVVQMLMAKVSAGLRRDCKECLKLLDSTPISLKGREFDRWTKKTKTRRTQGVKLHILYDSQTQSPEWQSMTAPNVNDVTEGLKVPLHKDAIYVFDKGYCDYDWWNKIDQADAQFVTRFKSNAGIDVVGELPIENVDEGKILGDQLVRFRHKHTRGGSKMPYHNVLRCVRVLREEKETPLILATNDLTSPARVIAQRYKQRWDVELYFKWIKQHLKIKNFLGRSEKAVRIQLLTALIAYLLVALYKQTHQLKGTLWECLRLIRYTLVQLIIVNKVSKQE